MTTTRTATSTWTIDPAHSSAEFAVKHLMVSTFKGHFRSLEGTVHLDEANPANSSVAASVDVASVDTQTPDRDAHLRSDDFFNAERYPKMTFRSTRVEQVDGTNWKVTGELTVRDVTKEVVLDTEYEGRIVDPWGNERIGFTARTELSRKEFGVRWNAAIETGGVVVGDKVRISLNIEIVRQQS
ncbi:MAG TPA: YceI family protein [Dehalococcoidia bacterium]|nr:YceI family protein [Dehalococcoidia bacterium]